MRHRDVNFSLQKTAMHQQLHDVYYLCVINVRDTVMENESTPSG